MHCLVVRSHSFGRQASLAWTCCAPEKSVKLLVSKGSGQGHVTGVAGKVTDAWRICGRHAAAC